MNTKGVIYILTNPSFPDYVKIGYADNMEICVLLMTLMVKREFENFMP